MKRTLLNVNGVDRWVVAEKTATLADILREQMLLTGCKVCCEDGQCGSCTVIVDGKPDRSCQTTLEKLAPGGIRQLLVLGPVFIPCQPGWKSNDILLNWPAVLFNEVQA